MSIILLTNEDPHGGKQYYSLTNGHGLIVFDFGFL